MEFPHVLMLYAKLYTCHYREHLKEQLSLRPAQLTEQRGLVKKCVYVENAHLLFSSYVLHMGLLTLKACSKVDSKTFAVPYALVFIYIVILSYKSQNKTAYLT